MASQVSPGISIAEIDKTLSLGQVALTEGAIAGYFTWGPLEEVTTVSSEEELATRFGKPDSNSANYFFTASSFLGYSNTLRVARVANAATGKAATPIANGTVLAAATFSVNATANVITAVSGNTSALYAGQVLGLSNSTVSQVKVKILAVTNTVSATLVTTPSAAVTSGNLFSYGIYVKNDDHYESTYSDGSTDIGSWCAKWVGILGNTLKIEACASSNAYKQTPAQTITTANAVITASANVAGILQVGDIITANTERRQVISISNNTVFTVNAVFTSELTANTWTREWQYAGQFSGAPTTSDFVTERGGSLDEMHVIVIDANGALTGAANTVLEKYAFVSKASDAKTETGASNYYKQVINDKSSYVRWLDHMSGGTNFGSTSASTTFGLPALIEVSSLDGGTDGGTIVAADLYRGYDLIANELVEVSFVLGASATAQVASYIISNVVEPKKFAIGFFSPERSDVVDNVGSETTAIIDYRNNLPSTSFAVLDSGWKKMYDKYNDVFRWVPLNGDTAGCCVRADSIAESWYSPAGFTRGQIKNVVKLAFNPNLSARDDLYRNGINPVVTFPGQGTILYGDKTLLSRPSAFDRINVRRLFIVLEKTIQRSAAQQLFEQNDAFTRSAFVNMVEPFLRSVRGRRGITDYFVVCDESNNPPDAIDRNEFRAEVYCKPIHSINFISLSFVVVRSDVDFSEVITNLS